MNDLHVFEPGLRFLPGCRLHYPAEDRLAVPPTPKKKPLVFVGITRRNVRRPRVCRTRTQRLPIPPHKPTPFVPWGWQENY